MSKTIISIRAYNRPQKIKNLLDSIKHINLSKFNFYFFVDGPNNIDDIYLIDQTLKEINSFILKKKAKIFIQKKNLGLKKHWIFCMNKTFQKTNKAIFLEDDFIISKNFLKFISLGLDKYEMVKKVKSVCGHLPINIKANKKVFFAYRASVWGFGTWKRVWDECKLFMRKKNKSHLNFNNKKNLIVHGRDLHTALARNILGKQSTFAIWWAASIIMNKGLNLYPAESLVNNDGLDGTGTNCIKTNFYKSKFNNKRSIYNMPRAIEIDDKLSFRISKKTLYSKSESFLYLYLNAKLAYAIIFMYLFVKKFFYHKFF
jgi:hypothetical protein